MNIIFTLLSKSPVVMSEEEMNEQYGIITEIRLLPKRLPIDSQGNTNEIKMGTLDMKIAVNIRGYGNSIGALRDVADSITSVEFKASHYDLFISEIFVVSDDGESIHEVDIYKVTKTKL